LPDINGKTGRARQGYTLPVNGLTSDAPPATALALQVKDLRVSYGPKRAVDGVSLDINEGEIFGLWVRTEPARQAP
jgi:ABC-type glutathione transport system ATPase component